jgi:hypothetical protein
MNQCHWVDADMLTDDEFHTGQTYAGVWHHSAAKSQIGIAQVHHDRGLRQHHNHHLAKVLAREETDENSLRISGFPHNWRFGFLSGSH